MLTIHDNDPIALEVKNAIHNGDLTSLERLLTENPRLASAAIENRKGRLRTLLHLATDWPGHFPNGRAIVACLIKSGADANARPFQEDETPLHWAASSDDVEVADALIAGGADLNTTGGSIGTPLENAIGYGQWQVARFLADRGAKVDELWVAAALGMASLVEQFLHGSTKPTSDEINNAFWQACHGGQIRTAKMLLQHGADLNFTPDHNSSTPLEIAANFDGRREPLMDWLKQQGARPAKSSQETNTHQ